jgi:hypothetical protein
VTALIIYKMTKEQKIRQCESIAGRLRLEPKRASGTGELPRRWWNMGIIVGSHHVISSICRWKILVKGNSCSEAEDGEGTGEPGL